MKQTQQIRSKICAECGQFFDSDGLVCWVCVEDEE
jgi:predicted amidophosphoribosyltransferase